jgi:DNA-binding FadR family transcriptional regulator
MSTPPDALISVPWPRRPARLGIAVLAALADQVVSGRFAPGTALPTEPVLCQTFGVSRTVIRETLKVLEEKGLVRVKQGQGTTVTSPEQWDLLDPVVLDAAIRNDESLKILDDLVEVRVALECQMTRRAARTMGEVGIEELRRSLAALDRLRHNPPEYLVADSNYHDVIHRLSGNGLARSIIRSVHPHARLNSTYKGPEREIDIERSHAGHVAIYEHLARRDADAASDAMYDHIMTSWLERKQTPPRTVDDTSELGFSTPKA